MSRFRKDIYAAISSNCSKLLFVVLKEIIVPKVTAQGKTFECEVGDNLCQVLLANNVELYNGNAKIANCRGIGACGACTVRVDGKVSNRSWIETIWRLLPLSSPMADRRLACQTQVLGDVEVIKFEGFLGRGTGIVWTSEGKTERIAQMD